MSHAPDNPQIVSRDDWLRARTDLLEKEKSLTRARDVLAEERRAMPRVEITKDYVFRGPNGPASLSDLFGGRSQLAIYHFMFGADWAEGCPSCSFWADNFDGTDIHLAARDLALVMVSAAPFDKIDAYRNRMGWTLDWVSSAGSTFNRDLHVSFNEDEMARGDATYNYRNAGFPASEAPGMSFFQKTADGRILHSYSTYGRGLDAINSAYQILDLAPMGRDEDALPHPMAWIKRRDQYGRD